MMIDTHCHINDIKYDLDVKEVISRAVESGVEKMICVGTDLKTSEKAIELADKYSEIYATVGYHPHESKDAQKGYLYEFEEMAKNPKVVAIGESGLDYHYNISPDNIQKKIFREQIELAQDIKLPIIIIMKYSVYIHTLEIKIFIVFMSINPEPYFFRRNTLIS